MTNRHPRSLSRRQFLALAAATPALRAAVQQRSAAAQGDATPAQITVQADRELWRIPPGVRGFNFWGTRSDAAFMPEYQKIGLNLNRVSGKFAKVAIRIWCVMHVRFCGQFFTPVRLLFVLFAVTRWVCATFHA